MNKLIVLAVFAAVCAVVVSGQRGGRAHVDAAQGLRAASNKQTALNAGDKSFNQQQALLDKQQRAQARLDKKANRQERKRARAAKREQERIAAANRLDFENYENAAEFNNVEAAADLSKANKFGLQLVSESRLDESAALKQSNGKQAAQGTRLSAAEQLEAESLHSIDAEEEAEFIDENALSAAEAAEDTLGAKEANNVGKESVLSFQDVDQNQGAFHNQRQGGFAAQHTTMASLEVKEVLVAMETSTVMALTRVVVC